MLLLPLLFTLLLPLAHSSTHNQCPKCGSLEVPYPLSTTKGCGLPNYSLSCKQNTLFFTSADNFSYKVLSISPNTSRLVIQPPLLMQHTCLSTDLRVNGLRIDDSSPFNISKINTVMLFNCSKTILLSPLNCSSSSPCRLFEAKVKQGIGCQNTLCCSYLKDASMTSRRIRIRAGGCSAYTSVVDFKPEQLVDQWKFGIELQWLPPPN